MSDQNFHKIIILFFCSVAIGVSTYGTLGTRNARTEWERCFNNVYIEPILNVNIVLK